MEDFLTPNLKIPEAPSRYLRLKDVPEARVRLISTPIQGWLDWEDLPDSGRRPHRYSMANKPETTFSGDPKDLRYFWAWPIWNYEQKIIQIWEIVQASIMKPVKDYISDPDFGHPSKYDLVVKRTGQGKDTEYSVIAKPPKALDASIVDEVTKTFINMAALYESKDPFKKEEAK